MLAEIFRFFGQKTPQYTPILDEWLDVDLSPCENGKRILAQSSAWKHLTASTFQKLIQNVSFNSNKPLTRSSQLSILFKVVELGDLDKFNAIINLPSYDQMPLNLRNKATGKNLLVIALNSGNDRMIATIRDLLMKQHIEFKNHLNSFEQQSLNENGQGWSNSRKEVTFKKDVEVTNYEVDGPLRRFKYK